MLARFIIYRIKMFIRDKQALFWTIAFPLLFVFIFCGILGRSFDLKLNVALVFEESGPITEQFIKGLKEGGVLQQILREAEVEALPLDIPEKIELDISELVIGHSFHVSDLKISDKCEMITDLQEAVVTMGAKKEEEEEVPAPAEEAAPAQEPEVIKEKKEKEKEEEPEK